MVGVGSSKAGDAGRSRLPELGERKRVSPYTSLPLSMQSGTFESHLSRGGGPRLMPSLPQRERGFSGDCRGAGTGSCRPAIGVHQVPRRHLTQIGHSGEQAIGVLGLEGYRARGAPTGPRRAPSPAASGRTRSRSRGSGSWSAWKSPVSGGYSAYPQAGGERWPNQKGSSPEVRGRLDGSTHGATCEPSDLRRRTGRLATVC
jgi:hypothetical protein